MHNFSFFYVLVRFPGFLKNVKVEGADPDVVGRLTTFYQMNVSSFSQRAWHGLIRYPQVVRIFFRFLFVIPLFIMAVDVVQGPHTIVRIGWVPISITSMR